MDDKAYGTMRPTRTTDRSRATATTWQMAMAMGKARADGVSDTAVYESANLKAILKFADNHDLLNFVLLPERALTRQRTTRHSNSMDVVCLPKALLQTIQVLLAPAMFDLGRNMNHFSFAQSQQAVYATAETQKVFG